MLIASAGPYVATLGGYTFRGSSTANAPNGQRLSLNVPAGGTYVFAIEATDNGVVGGIAITILVDGYVYAKTGDSRTWKVTDQVPQTGWDTMPVYNRKLSTLLKKQVGTCTMPAKAADYNRMVTLNGTVNAQWVWFPNCSSLGKVYYRAGIKIKEQAVVIAAIAEDEVDVTLGGGYLEGPRDLTGLSLGTAWQQISLLSVRHRQSSTLTCLRRWCCLSLGTT